METHFPIQDCQFSIVEAARHLKISKSKLYELMRGKKIKTAKLGGRTIIPGAELKRFMADLASRAA